MAAQEPTQDPPIDGEGEWKQVDRKHGCRPKEATKPQALYSLSVALRDVKGSQLSRSVSLSSSEHGSDVVDENHVVPFFSGNPSVEVTSGVIHLFRSQANTSEEEAAEEYPPRQLCVLAVPSYMSPADFCQFTAQFTDDITDMRVLRDSSPNKYMVVMTFKEAGAAQQFHDQVNGKPFSSLEPEICHVLFVERLNFLDDPKDKAPEVHAADQVELPTCPVCLERLDCAVTGIMTILCNHSFHCQCLSRWGDSSCPVCRFCQEPTSDSECFLCGASENLWMCLLCGHVGCGRYQGAHSVKHFEESGHQFSMDLDTQRVWDYTGDGYVHRLIQNKADGKLVELPSHELEAAAGEFVEEGGEVVSAKAIDQVHFNSKLEAISLEYNYLLTTQLDTQRAFYEHKLADAEASRSELLAENQKLRARLEEAESARKADEKRCHSLTARLVKSEKDVAFLREMNDSLTANQQGWKTRAEKAEDAAKSCSADQSQRVEELEAQVRDLMFFLDAQNKIAGSADEAEIRQGHVVVAEAPSPPTQGKGHRKGRR